MEKKTIAINHYTNKIIDDHLDNHEAELSDFAKLQGKQDALNEHSISKTLFNINFLNPVISKTQGLIFVVTNTLLPASQFFSAKEIDETAKRNVRSKNNEINDKLHARAEKKRKLESIFIDPFKKKYSKYLPVVSITVGFGDAVLAFSGFRHSYPLGFALISALAVGLVIAMSHLGYTKWIKSAESDKQRRTRMIIVLTSAFLFFLSLGMFRADASNQTVNLNLDETTASVSNSHMSGLTIAIISFALFVGVFFLALMLWKTKKERIDEEEAKKLLVEIQKIDTEIKALKSEIDVIEENANKQKQEARIIYDFASSAIKRCKSIALNAVATYQKVYARFRNNDIPDFFNEPCDFQFDDSFQLSKIHKSETI
jgi:hypothetical protein